MNEVQLDSVHKKTTHFYVKGNNVLVTTHAIQKYTYEYKYMVRSERKILLIILGTPLHSIIHLLCDW